MSYRRLCTAVAARSGPGGFAQAFRKQAAQVGERPAGPDETFASLLRSSKFVDLGDPRGKIVYGEIVDAVEDDLYVDFGWKFRCVCSRPQKNGDEYAIGAKVRLAIEDLELSSRFLGSDSDLTLLEADCRLLGPASRRLDADAPKS